MASPHIIYLAGINNSEPDHWQRQWHRLLGGTWVDHADWDHPTRDEWVSDLERALRVAPGNKMFVAHSMGCLLAVEWARQHHRDDVVGAFMVAPPDVENGNYPVVSTGFGSAFEVEWKRPTWIIASQNDPFATMDYSRHLAAKWKTLLKDAGPKGHINLKSDLGFWDEGYEWLREFVGSLP